MRCCSLWYDAVVAFAECLHTGRGPIQLIQCPIDSQIIARALAGDSRVTRFKPYPQADMAVLFTALAKNRGLAELYFQSNFISNENWSILCESLTAHPSLTGMDLRSTSPSPLLDEQKAPLTRGVVAEMMKENTVLHTIHLYANERDNQIYAESILPHLESNLYRPRVYAIKRADIALRRPLLGRALQTESVRNKSNLLWMFLSANPDVVVSFS
jgi:hypothetical protein